ncbi:MAG: adenosylcobinamide-GDP ribazoletransferase [Thermodesulfobacteriota bacterium]
MRIAAIRRFPSLFASALGFLSILPAPAQARFEPAGMVACFPVAGLFLGLLAACLDRAACVWWSPQAAGVLDAVFLAVVSGGLHLDGLADAADGLMGHHGKDRALSIMKDSRVGAMGLLAVVLCLAVKTAGLAHLGPHRFLAVMLVPAYARALMLFGLLGLPYGRENGTGRAFFEKPLSVSVFAGLIPAALLSLFLGGRFFVLNLAFLLAGPALVLFYKKRLGVITGDMLGAMTEVGEALFFLAISARWPL